MTDKLLCPFCNKPLQLTLRQSDEYWCENYDCSGTNIEWVGSQKLWQELIRTRKALDILLFTINRLENQNYKDCAWHLRLAIAKIEASGIANKALKQITALEQKE